MHLAGQNKDILHVLEQVAGSSQLAIRDQYRPSSCMAGQAHVPSEGMLDEPVVVLMGS